MFVTVNILNVLNFCLIFTWNIWMWKALCDKDCRLLRYRFKDERILCRHSWKDICSLNKLAR